MEDSLLRIIDVRLKICNSDKQLQFEGCKLLTINPSFRTEAKIN